MLLLGEVSWGRKNVLLLIKKRRVMAEIDKRGICMKSKHLRVSALVLLMIVMTLLMPQTAFAETVKQKPEENGRIILSDPVQNKR